MKVAHDRLLSRLEKMVVDPKLSPMLQEPLVTLRGGRYVIPLRSDFKGKVPSVIHDQSSSGATLFVEPLKVVNLNNEWQELQLAERDEERRILAELSDLVGGYATEICLIVDALAELDLALACAKYSISLDATEPVFLPTGKPRENHPGSTIRLAKLRHPLLDPKTVVPIDVVMDEETFALVITGPNTGGKTVTLKTVGLMVSMAQAGLHIPAESGSTISIFTNVFADIGDEQSIEQSLSTFSAHITNIIRIMENMDHTTLVLLDELGSGTDPQEGAALARAILSHLVAWWVPCLVATHYPELKIFAHSTTGILNACMEFDIASLQPTYKLAVGLPGRSNALLIAERLGLSQDIIQATRTQFKPEDLQADNLLEDIHRQRENARREREEAENLRKEVENLQIKLSEEREAVDKQRAALQEQVDEEVEESIRELQTQLADLRQRLIEIQSEEELEQVAAEAGAMLEEVEVRREKRKKKKVKEPQPVVSLPKKELQVGDKVFLRTLQMQGVLISLDDNEAEVQLGALRTRVDRDEIQHAPEPVQPRKKAPIRKKPSEVVADRASARRKQEPLLKTSPGVEIDLRGERAEEALMRLDRYLDSAITMSMPYIRIIHGKGTGRLRQVVRESLTKHPYVERWEEGLPTEGGAGVTVAHLKT
jgi:DNA mismatch repair protein MutS2